MTITKEYCDRCGKEVESGPLDQKLFTIIWKSPKHYICFRDHMSFRETAKMVCEDCLKELWVWWKRENN